jgi:hypothetical protein
MRRFMARTVARAHNTSPTRGNRFSVKTANGVIVELGYRDEFDWRWDGHDVHLGQPTYDSYVRQRIKRYVNILGRDGTPILFLSVPWRTPRRSPTAHQRPQGSAVRHAQINSMLKAIAAQSPGAVQVVNIEKPVGAASGFRARMNGKLCRFDGVHFTVCCSRLLQQTAMRTIRRMIRTVDAARAH